MDVPDNEDPDDFRYAMLLPTRAQQLGLLILLGLVIGFIFFRK